MSLAVTVDPRLSSLLRALGLLDQDGRLRPSWFEHPLDAIRRCLEDEAQRAALFELLDQALPPIEGPRGGRWHPLFEDNAYGNVYLTVDGDVLGAAAAVGTVWEDLPSVRLSVSLPLVTTGTGGVDAQVGPLDVELAVELDPAASPSAVGVRVRVQPDGRVEIGVRLEDGGSVAEFDPASLDGRAVDAVQLLLRSVLDHETSADLRVLRLVGHLPGVVGLDDPALTPFPITDPSSVRGWLTGIAASPPALRAWFTHLSGALGAADLADDDPTIGGTGKIDDPLRAVVLSVGGVDLELRLATGGTPSEPALHLGVGLSAQAGPATVGAGATLAAIPLGGTLPATVLPAAGIAASVPVNGGFVDGGLAWNGVQIAPVLRLRGVTVGGTAQNLDLTDVGAVVAAVASTVIDELTESIGEVGNGQRALALLGLVAPSTDAQSPHTLAAQALSGNLLRAVAEVHRAALGDPAHPWSHILADLAGLLGLPPSVDGDGTRAEPWRVRLAGDDELAVQLAAWDDRDASTPAGVHLLRLGLRVAAGGESWELSLATEVLAFDLVPDAATAVRFVGAQHLRLAVLPGLLDDGLLDGVPTDVVSADRLEASLRWLPGTPAAAAVSITGLTVGAGADAVGPLDLTLPDLLTDGGDLVALVRQLLGGAWSLWGEDLTAHAIAGLLGVHDRLAGLPPDWPSPLPATTPDLAELLADPAGALARYARAVLTGVSADGTPFAATAVGWLGALVAGMLPSDPDAEPAAAPRGAGTSDDPWALPVAGEAAELLLWLDPGPAAVPNSRVGSATTGEALLSSLGRTPLLHGRDPAAAGAALDELAAWLADGDGLVPYASQVAVPAGWTVGTALAVPSDASTADPSAVAQVQARLASWAVPALLLSTATTPPWTALLAAAEPGHDPDARIDLLADPAADLSSVTAVARCYPVLLADADLDGIVTQIGRAAARVRALTGAATVALVGHGPGGVAARVHAARTPAGVQGVVTLASPHAGSELAPLTRADLADATRLADGLGAGGAVPMLRAILDGGPPRDGVLPPGTAYSPEAFAGVPEDTVDTVPGLAIGSRLAGNLVRDLATDLAAAAADLAAAAAARPRGAAVTHVGIGATLRLATPQPAAGEVDVDATLRVDLARIRIGPGAEPARSANRIALTVAVGRQGGWLVGDAGVRTFGAGAATAVARARWAELEVTFDRAAGGGLTVSPALRLHEAGLPGTSATVLDLDAVLAALAIRPATVALPSELDGPAAALLLQCLRALGLTTTTGALDVAELTAAAASPVATIGPRLPALLTVLAPAIGASTTTGGGWSLPLLGGTHELRLTPSPWTLRIATPGEHPVQVDVSVALPSFQASATAALAIGPMRLTWDGALRLAMPPWLPPIRLAPGGDPAAIGAAIEQALPRALLSAALGLLTAPVLPGPARSLPLDRLVLNPAAFLGSALGDENGLRADRVNAVLEAVGEVVGLPSQGGLDLPAGLRLAAVEPFELRLTGTLDFDGATLDLGLGLRLAADLTPSPAGTASLTVTLPGNWGGLTINLGAAADGVSLSVEPDTATGPIELLPRFDGFGAVVAGATALLPHVLQALVDELSPPGPLLAMVLDIAEALGIYGDDAQGFERPDRAAKLGQMLQPGWLQAQVADAPTLVTRIAALFSSTGPLPVPLGAVTATGRTVRWTVPLPDGAGTITAGLGWNADDEPLLTLTATGVDLGPVVLDSATVGFDGEVSVDIVAHLSVDGILAPVQPAVELGVTGGRFAASILPLGPGTADDFELALAPSVQVTVTEQAAIDLVVEWGIPLVSEVLLRALDGLGDGTPLLERPFWTGGPAGPAGPTARTVLDGAGLVPLTGPVTLNQPLPSPLGAVLGALRAAASGVQIAITDTLTLRLVTDPVSKKTGIRLVGHQDIAGDDVTVRVLFGKASWLTDPAGGVTLWLMEPDPAGGQVPIRLTAELSAAGLGAVIAGEPLVDGSVVIGAAGGVVFFHASFLDAARNPALDVADLGAAIAVERAFVKVDSGDGDSFLAKVLPSELKSPFDLAVLYRDGVLQIAGTSPLSTGRIELVIPLDIDLSIIQITELLLALQVGSGQASLEGALSGGLDVGPIAAFVKRVGLIATFGGPSPGLRLRAPDQVGMSIDTSTLRLGGFLLVDEPRGRYIGAIEIAVLGKFELTAIGIITTKMPDGSPGFSLLFIITMTLPVPIPMGYGFFFAGAGGLLGLNRGTNLDALRSGLRTGAAESILFPKDIVRRADAIVRDLEAVFPIAQGQFVVGPMVMITWSSPPIISIQVGIILELGTPIRIAILGLLRVALPDPAEAVLNLKVAFLGTIDLAAGLLSFDAAIYDSFIGAGDFKLSIDGDIAVRLSWGERPDFVLSVGGFHPIYQPEKHLRLPDMKRLTLSLLRDNPHLTLSTYFAITANTVQFGAHLDFRFEVSGFSIVGEFGFDVLFQFSPFYFEAVIRARLAVISSGSTLLTLALDFSLRGPTPWIARGIASFSVLFLTVEVAFEKIFGEELLAVIPDIAVLAELLRELTRPESWVATLSAGATAQVSLQPLDPPAGTVVIDAGGDLTISQRVLPLATEVTRFGTARPNDVSRVEIAELRLGGQAAPVAATSEMFSPAAFDDSLSDDDKLRSPAFVPRQGGVRATLGTGLRTDYAVARPAHYDLIVCDTSGTKPVEDRTTGLTQDSEHFEALARGGATGRSSAARELRKVAERGVTVGIGEPAQRYAVTGVADLRPLDAAGVPAEPTGTDALGQPVYDDGVLLPARTDAQARLRALAGGTDELQILPAAQLPLGVAT